VFRSVPLYLLLFTLSLLITQRYDQLNRIGEFFGRNLAFTSQTDL
jgi:hypothetical protein